MTRVRLTDAETWPQHHSRYPNASTKGWPKARGMFVVVGKPRPPQKEWICGTDVVWPVISWDENLAQPAEPGCMPYVCRHQIQAGD